MTDRKNCWEHKRCGRERGGAKVDELGICPAASEGRLDGTHGGTNAGRACWVVAGSLCGGKVQGTFAQKFQSCSTCDFYLRVRTEEGLAKFELTPTLLGKLRKPENPRVSPDAGGAAGWKGPVREASHG